LNYFGVVFAVGAIFIFLFIKTEVSNAKTETLHSIEHVPINRISTEHEEGNRTPTEDSNPPSVWDRLPPTPKKILGTALAVLSGVFYGVNFDPPQYLIDHKLGSPHGIDYVFSHFTGIFLASLTYLLIYSIFKRNKPAVYPQALLPGFISGVLWAIAQTSFFIANEELMFVITFPIISTGPGLVAAAWSVFVFGEIKGLRNYLLLGLAFFFTIVGVVLITLSKYL
jgi:hypothetical protein